MPTTFNNAQVALSTTATTTIYQAPSTANNVGIVLSMIVANVTTSSTPEITVLKTSSADTVQSNLAFAIPVPWGTALECVSNKVVLKAGEKIRASSNTANALNVTVSVMEIT